jgi:hypothetical protein
MSQEMSDPDDLAYRLRQQTALADLGRQALATHDRDDLVDLAAATVTGFLQINTDAARALL